jgi:hypothetical protein
MSVNVYWSCIEEQGARASQPENISKIFYQKEWHDSNNDLLSINKCPFFNESIENIFALRSIYDYSFKIEKDKTISTPFYNETFFKNHVLVRSMENKFFSFNHSYVFFTDKPSLLASVSQPPIYEDNNISERCIVIGGNIDIGKYFRNTDFTFLLKNKYDEFLIENNEIFSYIKFHTKEKINFKQFFPSVNILELLSKTKKNSLYRKENYVKTKFFYNNFTYKKIILKEIKKNLI